MKLARPLLSGSIIATQRASANYPVRGSGTMSSSEVHFSCSTAPQAFPRPDRGISDAVERRSRQGWPLLRPPPGLALMPIEHDGTLAVSGANTLATSQFRFPLSLQNRGKCFREAHQLGRFRDR